MAVTTLLLLWLFQFLFFDVLYYNRQEAHIKQISKELLSEEYGIRYPGKFSNFKNEAKKQNLFIYIFIFNKGTIIENDGVNSFPYSTEVYIYTPYFSKEAADVSEINWSGDRINEYLSNLKSADSDFTFIEKNSDKNSLSDVLIYGGDLNGYFGEGQSCCFCLVSSISRNNYMVTIMRNMLLTATVVLFTVSVILSLIFSRKLTHPINRLANTSMLLAKGDFDINFEKSSFVEINQLADSLNFAKEELSKTENMRREFIANVSHDLRTPLTMIKAYAEMIRDLSGKNEEKRTKHCQIIIDESNRLSMLVADIQNLSKLQSGTDSFQIKRFDLSELCKTVIVRFSIMSETHGYNFITDCDKEAFCYGDYQKIEQVLYNLIGNALNYTGEDKQVTVRCKQVDEGYKVEIIDSGKGIDPSEIDSVWDRYYRANQKKRNIVGSGLGLNIVKIVLDGHKTQYGVESVLDKGTTFWFILPKEQKEI